MKRPIVHYYSASSVAALEPLMDKVIADFCGHLEKRFIRGDGKYFDLGEWIAFCKSKALLFPEMGFVMCIMLMETARFVGCQWCCLL